MSQAWHRALLSVTAALVACVTPVDNDAAPARMVASEELRIGSVDDSTTSLTYMVAAVVDGERRIYSLHVEESAVRVHDEAGTPLFTMGRSVKGQASFRGPRGSV